MTWRNELPAGERVVNGVAVRRFPVEEERDLAAFNRFAESLYDRPHSDEDERAWLRRQGPVRAARSSRRCARSRTGSGAILFFTYLYYPTVEGLRAAPERVDPRARPPTTSRRCASASTASCSRGRARSRS